MCLDVELEYCHSTLFPIIFIVLQMHQKRNITGKISRRIGQEEEHCPCKRETFRLAAHNGHLGVCVFKLFG